MAPNQVIRTETVAPPKYVLTESMMNDDSDRFLEEVILSKKPQYEKQVKNEFLPKTTPALQTIHEGEMSL